MNAVALIIVRGDLIEVYVRRDAVMGHHISHTIFHAVLIVSVIGLRVIQPARVIAIKTALIFCGQAPLPAIVGDTVALVGTPVIIGTLVLRDRRQRQEHTDCDHENSEEIFHRTPPGSRGPPGRVPSVEGDRLRIPADEHQRQWSATHLVWASPRFKSVGTPSGLADDCSLEPSLGSLTSTENTVQNGSLPTAGQYWLWIRNDRAGLALFWGYNKDDESWCNC